MASVTLPTTLVLTNDHTPKIVQTGSAIIAGRSLVKNSAGKAEHATNSDISRARVFGIALASAPANSWVTYAEPGDRLTVSGLTKGVSYYLDHGTNEVQTATITGTPTGGTFRLSFGSVETANIAYNAAAATVQSALEALSTIGTGNVTVSGSAGGPYTITFVNSQGGKDVAMLVLANNSLTGGTTPSVSIVETTPGVTAGNICPFADLTSGHAITVVGVAESTTQLNFDPIITGATV